MAKGMDYGEYRLDLSLFSAASARKVPFGILQFVQYIPASILLCVPFVFADGEKDQCV